MFVTTAKNLRAKLLIGAFFLFAAVFFAPLTTIAQTAPAPKPCFDFVGSGRTSFATVTRGPQNNTFRILGNSSTGGGILNVEFGLAANDNLTPGYFDNDNRADIGVYRTTEATYFLRPSTAPTTIQAFRFGLTTDISGREADYDGDGRDDLTVVRDGASSLTWFFLRSSNNTVGVVNFGAPGFSTGRSGGDVPIAGADYNGDGRAEITVIRDNPSGPDIYLAGDTNTGALVLAQPWGEFETDFYVVGDYLGDRRADFAVFRAFAGGTTGNWFIRENGGNTIVSRAFGFTSLASAADRPICGDYNGDGKQDIAIYRSSNSSFFWLNSPDFNTFSGQQFGQAGDFPIAGLRAF
jgi:hypothetical protein